jgi:hypothetical protein
MLSAKNFIKIHTVIALLSLPSHSAKTKHKDSDQVFVGFAAYNSKLYQMFRKLLPIDALNNGYIFVDGDDAIKFEEKTVFNDEVHFDDRGNRLLFANDSL